VELHTHLTGVCEESDHDHGDDGHDGDDDHDGHDGDNDHDGHDGDNDDDHEEEEDFVKFTCNTDDSVSVLEQCKDGCAPTSCKTSFAAPIVKGECYKSEHEEHVVHTVTCVEGHAIVHMYEGYNTCTEYDERTNGVVGANIKVELHTHMTGVCEESGHDHEPHGDDHDGHNGTDDHDGHDTDNGTDDHDGHDTDNDTDDHDGHAGH
jgi:hypothetical protein